MYVSKKKTIAVSIENYQKLKRYGLAGDSLNSAISKLFRLADSAAGVQVSSGSTTIEYPSATITATKISDHVYKLRNAKVTDSSVYEITTQIRSLIDYCNAKFLKDFPIDVVYKPTILQPEIKSWYAHDLNLNNISKYIINTLKELESSSYHIQLETSNRRIDAIRVLADYLNTVV